MLKCYRCDGMNLPPRAKCSGSKGACVCCGGEVREPDTRRDKTGGVYCINGHLLGNIDKGEDIHLWYEEQKQSYKKEMGCDNERKKLFA